MNSAPPPAPTLEATPYQASQLMASLLSDRHRVGTLPVRIPLDGPDAQGAGAVVGLPEAQRAWTALLRSTTALRVRFHDTPDGLVQEPRGYDGLPEDTVRVTLGDDDPDADGLAPFGPVLLTARLDLRGSGPVLAVRVHHALVDEHSVLLLGRALRHFLAHPDALPEDDGDHYRRAQDALLEASRRPPAPRPGGEAPRRPADPGGPAAPLLSRPGTDPRERAHHVVRLAPETVKALRRAARQARASAVSVAHAAVLAALHRLVPDRTPVVGVPMTLRDLRAVGFDAVGLYLNVVPTTIPCSENDTFGDLVERVRAESLALHGRKFASVGDLAAADGVARPGNRAYADLVLAFRDGSLPPGTDERAAAARRTAEPGAPLNVEVVLGPEHGLILFDWRSGLVPWPPAAQLASAVVQALTELPARPDGRVGEFALLDAGSTAEVRRHLGGQPPTAGAPAPSVVELVERAAARAPDAPALSDAERTWTYDELAAAVRRVRAVLRSRELPRGARVAVACGLDAWQVATALAVWQEGLCYVPVDPRGPAERNRFVLADSKAALVVCAPGASDASFLAGTPERDVVTTDALPPEPADGTAPAAGRPEPDEPAYLMYTSGTTGRPKGVTVTHHNLAGFLRAMTLALPGAAEGDWLAETSPSFDISYVEMFWPLTHGRHVQLRSPDAREDPGDGRPFAHRQCTPARAGQLLTARELGHPLGRWDVAPRYWLLGGERLPGALLERLRAAYPDTVFVNMYGPTEATVWATYHVVRGDEGADVPLGRPLPNSGVLVTDPHGHDVPEGVVGELLVIGDSVASGYLNRPDATRRRFTTVATAGGTRAYRTGDLVCAGPDGRLYFRGRDDDQVKIRGHRVEPGELEQRLLVLPGVREAVAVVLDAGDPERIRLAAAVTVADPASFDPAQARRLLAAEVPEAMLPAELVVLDALPRLTNGKADRLAVRAACEAAAAGTGTAGLGPGPLDAASRPALPGTSGAPGSGATGEAPDPALGAVLAAAEKIFHRAVGDHENFFDLGGNSLTALRLTALVRAEGFHLEVEDVLDLPDMRALADQAAPGPGPG
ncbi:amino acid adenylation domain-containing protein [Streptomyces sp. LP11]|uniref:Amino acid adenylation domain-containing protein n=1 Tax=Streptomyces pyxinicus TaxID=2970331 RepID=A0ABT2AX89_9ACTN|nr:non-ribosomal peptide synthetase [Streptomyces sp. LP11]MCS0600859.1 amino acid adenylation domain-containing protein [Streptomyces sp. LP11]